jgi:sulfur carrier protein ThiS
MKYANRNFVNSDARAFVALVKNAQCVISNSFHGSAFALLYNKDFFVVNRADGLNTRMRDLLSHYGIDQRLISVTVDEDVLLSHIDYSAVNKILNEDIGNSKRWLQEQIECV